MEFDILNRQKEFVINRNTESVQYRKAQLSKLKDLIKSNESGFYKSIYQDLRKSEFETYTTELVVIYNEINRTLKNLGKWARPKKVKTGIAAFPGKSYIQFSPYGNTLIIGSWNYPFLLTIQPVISAIAAGNTVILKPSEVSGHSSSFLAKLLNENFDHNLLYVFEGGAKMATDLLSSKFDKIFFTGSTLIGKIVMEAAAKNLIPVTLELGGKSPCIVLPDTDLKMAAKRIVWGKFINAGQTCIAPDFVLIHEYIKDEFEKLVIEEIKLAFGDKISENKEYPRIITQEHLKRLLRLIEKDKVVFGGNFDMEQKYLSPTIMQNVLFEDKIMHEEIFGPVLPLVPFNDFERALSQLKKMPRPLSLYLFTKCSKVQKRLMTELSFGGATINDTIMHFVNPNLPFGGVAESGFGKYHGKFGFEAFSQQKSILKKAKWFEPFMRYHPYSNRNRKIIKLLMDR